MYEGEADRVIYPNMEARETCKTQGEREYVCECVSE